MRRTRRFVIFFAALTAPMILLPSSAQAASYTEWNRAVESGPPPAGAGCDDHFNADSGTTLILDAAACFVAYGDYFYVKDLRPDGKSAVAYWVILEADGRRGACRNSLGAGKWGRCNKNLPEGRPMQLRAGTYDGDSRIIDDSGDVVYLFT